MFKNVNLQLHQERYQIVILIIFHIVATDTVFGITVKPGRGEKSPLPDIRISNYQLMPVFIKPNSD